MPRFPRNFPSAGFGARGVPGGGAFDDAGDDDDDCGLPQGPDLYAALGVGREATPAALKRAYRGLAMRYHPDKNPGDAEAARLFAEISHAYDVLSDPSRRKYYDDTGSVEGIDQSAEEYVGSFRDVMAELMGDGSVADMVQGMSKEELEAMPPFPFPKELFPEGTFPEGMRFSSDGIAGMPPAMSEMLARGEMGQEELESLVGAAWQRPGQAGVDLDGLYSSEEDEAFGSARERRSARGGGRSRGGGSGGLGDGFGGARATDRFSAPPPELAELFRSWDARGDKELSVDDLDDLLHACGGELPEGLMDFLAASSGMMDSPEDTDLSDPDFVKEIMAEAASGAERAAARARLRAAGARVAPARPAPRATDVDAASAAKAQAAEIKRQKKRAKEKARKQRKAQAAKAEAMAREAEADGKSQGPAGAQEPSDVSAPSAPVSSVPTQPTAEEASAQEPPANVARTWLSAAKDGCCELMGEALQLYPSLLTQRSPGIGHTALHWAAAKDHAGSTRWLLERGADPLGMNGEGSSALHSAAANGKRACAMLLAEVAGDAGLSLIDANGLTPAQLARQHGHADLARALEAAGGSSAPASEHVSTASDAAEVLVDPPLRAPPSAPETSKEVPRPSEPSPPSVAASTSTRVGTRDGARPKQAPRSTGASRDAPESSTSSDSDDEDASAKRAPSPSLLAKADAAKVRGNKAFNAGDHVKAVTQYSMAIRLCPDDAVYWSNRSGARCALRQYEGALEDAQRAIKLRPTWGKAHARKGAALVGMGQAGEGVKAYKTGLAACPDSERAPLEEGLREAKAAIRAHQQRFNDMWGNTGSGETADDTDAASQSNAPAPGRRVGSGENASVEAAAEPSVSAAETPKQAELESAIDEDLGGGVECGDVGGGSPVQAGGGGGSGSCDLVRQPQVPSPTSDVRAGAASLQSVGAGGAGSDVEDGSRAPASAPAVGSSAAARSRAERLEKLRAEAAAADALEEAAERAERAEREAQRAKSDAAAAACGVAKVEGREWLEAAKKGELAHLAAALARNPRLLQYAGEGTSLGFTGHSALHWAAAKGRCEAVRWLLRQGANPDAVNKAGSTAVHAAAQNNQLEAAKVLMYEGGSDGFVQDDLQETAREVAVAAGHQE